MKDRFIEDGEGLNTQATDHADRRRRVDRFLESYAKRSEMKKQGRWPSGAPGGKGGQFAPGAKGAGFSGPGKKPGINDPWPGEEGGAKKPPTGAAAYSSYGSLFGSGSKFPGGQNPAWGGAQMGDHEPPKPPPGAKPHPQVNDKGQRVVVNYPTKPSDPASWTDPKRTATFVPGGDTPASLNGVAMKSWRGAPKTTSEWAAVPGQNPKLDADLPFEPIQGKSVGAGVIIKEPDGRIWLTSPTNAFGGYRQTFPKGTVEDGLSLQASAIKEAYEETGLQVRITGVLGDYERTTSKARFFVAERIGGTPKDMGWESQAMRLATIADARKLLNMGIDKGILEGFDAEENFDKAKPPEAVTEADIEAAFERLIGLLDGFDPEEPLKKEAPKGKKSGAWSTQPRWPSGSALGGQWKQIDGNGFAMPPTIAGGLSGANPSYQKKANALYAALNSGDKTALIDAAFLLDQKAKADIASGKKSTHVKWTAQVSQYANALVSDLALKPKVETAAAKASGSLSLSLSSMPKTGGKPGGSNPGGMHKGPDGADWLVKGNKQFADGKATSKQNDDRAKNEVLASKLMQAVGVGAPTMALVDLEGKYGGGLGVASKMVGGGVAFNPKNAAHIAAARATYATHAWLGNYDVLGMGFDNTIIVNGAAVNIDPGGAILFRAQGLPKDKFGKDASEFETMRVTTGEQKAVFGGMTASELKASAENLASISDDTIKSMVDTYGPGTSKEKADLAETLIARRDAILAKVGLKAQSEVTPPQDVAPPTPPKLADAVPAPAGTALPSTQKPTFNSGLKSDAYYGGLVDDAEKLHAAGDLAGLKAMVDPKFKTTWEGKTANSKKLVAYHGALLSDLQAKQDDAVAAVAQGNGTVTGKDGVEWKADDKGVLQPEAKALTPEQLSAIVSAAGFFGYGEGVNEAGAGAVTGNIAPVLAWKPNNEAGRQVKAAVIAAMTGKPVAAPAAPDLVPIPLTDAHVKSVAGVYQPKKTADYKEMVAAAKAGDIQGVQAVMAKNENVAFKHGLMNAMGASITEKQGETLSVYALKEIIGNAVPLSTISELPDGEKKAITVHLYNAATKGNLGHAEGTVVTTPEGKKVKAAVIEAMGGGKPDTLFGQTNAFGAIDEPDPVASGATGVKALTPKEAEKLADPYLLGMSDDDIGASFEAVLNAATAGDAAGVASVKFETRAGKSYQSDVLAAMGVTDPVPVAQATAGASDPEPAVAVPKGAAPNFDAYKTTSAANPGHNPKVDAIKAAFEAGDEKSLLAMSFGTNTYGKKQAQIANDALAALGSAHQVAPGQKKGEHPALVGGLSQPVPAGVKAQPVPPGATPAPAATPKGSKPKPTMADIKESNLPAPPDMLNYNGNGQPYSSKAWKNAANQQALNAILQAGLTGGPSAIDALQFDQLDPETGAPTGKKIGVNEHPAKKVIVAYSIDVKNAINDFLNPPRPLGDFNHVSAASVQEAAKGFLSAKGFATVTSQPKSQQFGFWIALGNTSVEALKPPSVKDYSPTMKSAGKAAYKSYSPGTKTYINHVQQSGQINRAIDEGKSTYAGIDLKPMVKQLYKDATPLEAGSAIYRWQSMPAGMMKQMESATPGLVFQSTGGFCTSMHPSNTSHFGGNRVKLVAAPGAKAIHSHGSGGYAGEEEITTLPGQRYVLLSKKKMPNGKNWDIELLILPPDDDWANSLA